MVDETKDLDKLLKGKEGEKVMKDLRTDFQEHAEGLGEHLEEIKGHTSGNKALNLLQVADVANRRSQDAKASKVAENIREMTKRQEDDFAGAHRGREDIQLKLAGINSKLNNMSGGGNGGGGLKMRTAVFSGSSGSNDTSVGDGVLVNEFGRPISSGSQSSDGQVFGGVEKINEIKAGSMDKKALFTGMAVSSKRKEGSAQAAINNITKSFIGEDGLANSDKVNKLNDELNAGGKDTQEIFKQYIQSLRDQSTGKRVDTKKFEAQGKALKAMGEGSVLAEVGNSYKRGSLANELMGRAQDGSGFVKDSFVKEGGVLGKVGRLPGRAYRKIRGIPENDANEENVSATLKKIATNVGGGFREKERQAGGKSSAGQTEKTKGNIVGSGKAQVFQSGIDSNNRVVELLELIEENTRELSGGGGGGGGLGGIGLAIGAAILAGVGTFLAKNWDSFTNAQGDINTAGEKTMVTAIKSASAVAMAPLTIAKGGLTAVKAGASGLANTGVKVAGKVIDVVTGAPKLAINSAGAAFDTATGRIVKQTPENIVKAGGSVAEQVVKSGTDDAAKFAAKSSAKFAVKKIPLIGAVAGAVFAAKRLMDGDVAGAALELTSGGAALLPGAGTVASVGIDAAILARDITRMGYNDAVGEGIYDRGFAGGLFSNADLDRERVSELNNKTIGQILADNDLSDSDKLFLETEIQNRIAKQTIPTASAVENMTDASGTGTSAEITPIVNVNVPEAQKIEVDKVVSAIMPHSVTPKNHSFQRFQDFASQYS